MTWWSFGDLDGVLELDAPALELHWHLMGGHSVAWWTDDRGRVLWVSRVGQA